MTVRDRRDHRPKALAFALLLFWLANLAFLLRFADRDGYEGDDLNSILPMAHLAAAKHGLLLIYRYGWQPLSYEVGATVWSIFGTPTAVFLLAPVTGASAIALLLWWLWREGRSGSAKMNALIAVIALLGIPEFWYSSLYYNSTILGMPLLAAALLLVRTDRSIVRPILAGILTGLAIMLRLDFILICPLLAVAAWPHGKGLSRPVVLALAVIATLLVGFAAGLLDLPEIIRIQAASIAEIHNKAHMPGWDLRVKLFVATVSLSPVGWLLLLGSATLVIPDAARRRDWRALAWLAATVPATYPIFNILTPKYILPLAPFVLLFFVRTLEAMEARFTVNWRARVRDGLSVVAITPIFISISLFGHAPYLVPGLAAIRPVGTHDGPRGYGGYLWQMMATDGPSSKTEKQRAAALLAQYLSSPAGKSLIVLGGENFFDPGAVGWRHLQLILEKRGIHGRLAAPHELIFNVRAGRWLVLADAMPAALPGGPYRMIDLRSPSDNQP